MNRLSPYKGLTPFEDSELDVQFFFGREQEREIITANLMASRLTVLYGQTGVGKSSVLRAGVAHHLRAVALRNYEAHGEPELAVVVFDAWRDDPLVALAEAVADAVRGALGGRQLQPPEEGTLVDQLQLWADVLGGDLYVILDQVEEYLLYHGTDDGPGTFGAEFPETLDRTDLRVNFLLSIREDALAKLDVFKGRVPNVLGNYLRLDHLDRRAARAAIVEPIAQYNRLTQAEPVEIETALVEAVLDEVAAGKVELGQSGRGSVEGAVDESRVETPFLQLVLQRLWEEERSAGSATLRLSTFRELGGAEQIVRDHLERALDALSAPEKDIAASMLDHLVTPSGTKIAHRTSDLAGYARVAEADLQPVLAKLEGERILRSVAEASNGGSSRHEIYHDVLASPVLGWKIAHEAQRELAKQKAEADRRHRRLLWIAVAAGIAVAGMAAVTVFALSQRGEARSQARRAHARELAASAAAELPTDPERAVRLAVASARIRPTVQAQDVLQNALLASHIRYVLPAGAGPVRSARFSPDGTRVVTADADGEARVFDARTGRLLLELKQPAPLTEAIFSPDGTLLVTTSEDGNALLSRATTGQRLRTLRHGAGVTSAAFSRDGRLLVTTSLDRTARLWDVATGRLFRVLRHPDAVESASFSPDGSRVLTVSNDRFARIFAVDSGRLLEVLPQRGVVTSATFSPRARLVVTSSEDQTATVWNAATGTPHVRLVGHIGRVLDAAFSPRGTRIVTTGADGYGRIWSTSSGRLAATLVGHTNYVLNSSFSPNGYWLVTASLDRTARVWNAEAGDPRAVLAGHRDSVVEAEFSPDGAQIVTASLDGTARLWNSTIGPELEALARLPGPVAGIAPSPDGRLVAAGGPGPSVRVLRTDSGATVRTLAETAPVTGIAFGRGGLVVTAAGNHATVWRSGATHRMLAQAGRVTSVALNSASNRIATGGADGVVRVYDVQGRLLDTIHSGVRTVERVAFSPDGTKLAVASADTVARLWTLDPVRLGPVLRGHRAAVTSARFSSDGTLVVTSSLDHDARIWDAVTGRLLRVLRGHFARVSDATFSPDGRWVVTAGPGAAGLWRADNGSLVLFLRGHAKPLTSAWFLPKETILTASEDGTIRKYRCEICGGLDELVAAATSHIARLNAPLSAAQRRALFP